jgi:glycosyltransferase involved in cell wall biosynthesis
MRVLQVTPYFAPAWAYGGPPRVMYDYAAGLARRGHEVAVFTTDVLDGEHRAEPAHEVLEGVDVFRFPNVSNGLAWRTKKYLPRGLASALLRETRRFDAVHVTDARTLPTAAAYLAARRSWIPFCLSAHGSLPGSSGAWGMVKQAYDRALVEPMLRSAALLLAQTDHEAELYVRAGGRESAVRMLLLPVDPVPEHDGAAFRERAGLPPDARVVLFLGRIHRLKGLDLLVAALEPLLMEGDAVLAVVGRDDGQRLEVEQRFAGLVDSGRVRFLGPVYGQERFSAYAAADVFCLTPRHWEETSVAALEAAACGTPVVVSEQADLPGLEAAGGGFVVALEPEAIRAAVEHALEGGEEMGARAREHVRRRHAKDAIVARLESYLEEVT